MKTFIIAEAGVNHNGSVELALELVDTAARCGADAVKFQTFLADKLVAPGTARAEYQALQTGAGDQHSMLKALELSQETHEQLARRCGVAGIEFMSTPFDAEAATFLVGLGMRRIKIPSGEITNEPFLHFLAGLGRPLILSTGMADLNDIHAAIAAVRRGWAKSGIEPGPDALTILHCTSNYPAAYADVNMRAMETIARETGLPVGYSDHTLGLAVSTAAVALGATVIEKHFTTDRDLPGPDHKASLTPDELADMVSQIRAVEAALGSPVKQPTASEVPIRALVRRSVTTHADVAAGQIFRAEDLVLLRPGHGIPPAQLGDVIGCKAAADIAAGQTLQWSDIIP